MQHKIMTMALFGLLICGGDAVASCPYSPEDACCEIMQTWGSFTGDGANWVADAQQMFMQANPGTLYNTFSMQERFCNGGNWPFLVGANNQVTNQEAVFCVALIGLKAQEWGLGGGTQSAEEVYNAYVDAAKACFTNVEMGLELTNAGSIPVLQGPYGPI
jgi:hypothetical protein